MWSPGVSHRRSEIVDEAERLLTGHAADTIQGSRIPAWAPLNTLAHGDLGRLQSLAREDEDGHRGPLASTLAYLATEVLLAAPGEDELVELQRDALVPVELGVLDDTVAAPRTAAELAGLVMRSLDSYRAHRQR